MWANMALAYERLPRHIKERIANLRAKHSIEHSFGGSMSSEDRAKLSAANPTVEHPVVRTHPETNEKVLFVNQGFTSHFVNFHNMEDVRYGQDFTIEANNLLNYLVRQAEIPEYQVRLRWKPNTIAIWDNRSTQHYAIHDYYPAVRKMMRATIIGDTPF
jgi:taurine dioxygenase